MDLLNGLTDDQLAIAGCALALTVCGTLMSLSYYLGRFLRGDDQSEGNAPIIRPLARPEQATHARKKAA